MSNAEIDLIRSQADLDCAVELVPTFSGEFFTRICQYPVIVEMWEKKGYGRVKRAYEAAFTPEERDALAALYPTLQKWHLRTGTPLKVRMKLDSLRLLQRAVRFFGTA